MNQSSTFSFRRLLTLLSLTLTSLLWAGSVFLFLKTLQPLPVTSADRTSQAIEQLLGLRVALRSENAIPRMQAVFPEGGCFTVTLYALSWTNLLLHHQPEGDLRALAIAETEWALDQYDTPEVVSRFTSTQVRRGVFWLGQRNLVIAQFLKALPSEERPDDLVAEFHSNSESLYLEFLRSPTSHLDSYPGMSWPADNFTALVSLILHDELYQSGYRAAFERWKAWTIKNRDLQTDLPAGHVDSLSGELLQPSRGCANSWFLALLPQIDPELSSRWYAANREHHMVHRLGYRVFREYTESVNLGADIDSGPVIWGAGATATGVGLAASLANGDFQTAEDIHGVANTIGLRRTIQTDLGPGAQYLFGLLPVGDAFLTWAYTLPSPSSAQETTTTLTELVWVRKQVALIPFLLTVALVIVFRSALKKSG